MIYLIGGCNRWKAVVSWFTSSPKVMTYHSDLKYEDRLYINIEVFAIYEILLGWKTCTW